MKKRILALVLALTIVVGLGGQAWAEVLPGEVSASPEVSVQPEETTVPEVTVAPEESAVPEETESPAESAQPEETEVPVESVQPSAQPEETPEPSETPEEKPIEFPGIPTPYAMPDVMPLALPTQVSGLEDVVGTTIDVFDYWLVGQSTPDNTNAEILADDGINAGHVLLFGKGMSGAKNSQNYAALNSNGASGGSWFNNNGNWNGWSGSGSGPTNGIVSRNLGQDGYPYLNLTYGWSAASALNGRSRTESLAYLFDPDVTHGGKASYSDVGGLLQVNQDGYYYYDSTQNFASLTDGNNENFVLYQTGGVDAAGNSPDGQFFPFNTGEQAFNSVYDKDLNHGYGGYRTPNSTDAFINHYFGMHMQSRFVQQYQGHTDENMSDVVTYDFSGDDDVWIFIDGVLVADLGGIHDAVSVNINFNTGEVTISSASTANRVFSQYSTTLRQQFRSAGQEGQVAWRGNTFADDTYHTLDFFYLERGNTDSNMNLKYNLVSVPESSIIKVDQTGETVPGAGFALYMADQKYQKKGEPLATGTTDANGQFVLMDDEGYLVSLQEIWTKMAGNQLTYGVGNGTYRGNLILRETQKPSGYRSTGDIKLYLIQSNDRVLMLSDNYWETGAYAYVNSTISMNGQVEYNNGTSRDLDAGGTLFAVVLRRTSNVETAVPSANDDWCLMTGSAVDGWQQGAPLGTGAAGIDQLLTELHKSENEENYFTAQLDASGAYKLTASNLPGDIMTYYYMLGSGEKAKTQYTVGFYYTTAGSVAGATSGNTWRVTNSDNWDRVFSANVHVPNIKNRIFVQKLAPDGTPLEKAVFKLYGDEDCQTEVGTITTTNLTKEDHGIQLSGGGVYPIGNNVLPNDTYYLKEVTAPDGYQVNDEVVKIVVDSTGVYADAGDTDDGVVVARGVGSIVKSMAQFASLGDIDASLNNIVAKFYTVPSDTTLNNGTFEGFVWRTVQEVQGTGEKQFVAADGVTYHPSYMYSESDGLKVYDEKSSQGMTPLGMHEEYSAQAGLEYAPEKEIQNALGEEKPVYWMTTDTGWSKLMMEQCYTHSNALSEQGYNVTNLTNPTLYDLTNLFSGTVVVQVTNEPYKSLRITKQVEGVDKNSVGNQNYSFTVSKMNDNDNVDTSYQGKVQVRQGNGTPEEKSFENGVLTVTRQGVGSILIYNLSDGIYRVIESGHGDDTISVENGKVTWQSMSYQAGENATATESYAVGKIDSNAPDKNYAAVTVSNHYAAVGANQTLTVTKTVGGNMGDTTKDFAFTLEVKKGNQAYTGALSATEGPKGEAGTATTLTVGEGSTYTFDLKHNEQIAIHIPKGYTVKVTETAVDGYTTKWRSYTTGTEVSETNPQFTDGTATETITMNQNYTVDYLNECDMTVPPSGVDAQNPGISVMLGVAAASAVLIFGCSFLVWRRRRRDWM